MLKRSHTVPLKALMAGAAALSLSACGIRDERPSGETIYFGDYSAVITDSEIRNVIGPIAETLENRPDSKVVINVLSGTCSRVTKDHPDLAPYVDMETLPPTILTDLSRDERMILARARAIKEELVRAGVSTDQIMMGELNPEFRGRCEMWSRVKLEDQRFAVLEISDP